jgi:hypothetical protein
VLNALYLLSIPDADCVDSQGIGIFFDARMVIADCWAFREILFVEWSERQNMVCEHHKPRNVCFQLKIVSFIEQKCPASYNALKNYVMVMVR